MVLRSGIGGFQTPLWMDQFVRCFDETFGGTKGLGRSEAEQMNEVSESGFAASWINPVQLRAARTSMILSQSFKVKRRPFVSPTLGVKHQRTKGHSEVGQELFHMLQISPTGNCLFLLLPLTLFSQQPRCIPYMKQNKPLSARRRLRLQLEFHVLQFLHAMNVAAVSRRHAWLCLREDGAMLDTVLPSGAGAGPPVAMALWSIFIGRASNYRPRSFIL